MPQSKSDLFEILRDAHHDFLLKALRIETARGPRRGELLDAFTLALMAHTKAEEKTLYVELMESPKGRDAVELGEERHAMLEELIGECYELLDTRPRAFAERARWLSKTLEEHIREEESAIFEVAQEVCDKAKRQALQETFLRVEAQVRVDLEKGGGPRRGRRPGAGRPEVSP